MKSRKFLWLAIAISIAFPLTAKAQDAAAQNILLPGLLLEDISECKATLNNLDKLLKFSQQLVAATQAKYNANPNDLEAKAAYNAATSDYNKLTAWHERVSARIMAESEHMKEVNSGARYNDAVRDAENAAQLDALRAATDAARQTGAEAARGSMGNSPHGGGGCH